MLTVITDPTKYNINSSSLLNQVVKHGFVPTMGNLHEGHISLIREALTENEIVTVSIYVNPIQFAEGEDFSKYPRTFEEDLLKIKTLLEIFPSHKEVIVFHPKELYTKDFTTRISVGNKMTQILCGKFRPTHFDGVTTVVYLLLSIVKPTVLYLGQKDYQQCAIVSKMISDLQLNIKLKIMPIIRDSSGLALSSRNQYLSAEEKKYSILLYNTLLKIRHDIIHRTITLPILHPPEFDYLEVRNANTLELVEELYSDDLCILGVLRIGKIRLLDNLIIKRNELC